MGFLDNNGLDRLWQHINSLLGNYVPKARTINNKNLTDNITLTSSDVGAIPTSAKDAARAKAWVEPYGTSGMYMKDECYKDENGVVWRSLIDNNVHTAAAYPMGWVDVSL